MILSGQQMALFSPEYSSSTWRVSLSYCLLLHLLTLKIRESQTGRGPKHRAVVALHSEIQPSSPSAPIFFISTVQSSVHWFVQTLLELRNEL